eukprot:TRINITY_DN10334_c0_g1_i1.p1 TRINITY_DN10334_c0_g1~~TRINITY_DN10334_c0_g1_i1.p1  ORF type:complete len:1077 (+),score=236.71 TRINITY_DN10334_c0_g1_i1:51-3281(+)
MSPNVTTIWLHADNPYQEIQSIGACDGVGVEVVGSWKNGEDREKVSELLFDTKFDDQGFPQGIGLSGWRFRFGSGSKRTKEGTRATQVDTFLRDDWMTYGLDDIRAYDFTRCSGQQWFLHTAMKYHVQYFTASSHAPPYPLVPSRATQDSNACSLWSDSTLLAREYATYLTRLCRHFDSSGVTFKGISPVRTTHSGGGVVEGCKYTHRELHSVLQCIDEALNRFSMDMDIVAPDSISTDFLTACIPGKEDSSDFLFAFFGGKKPHAMQRMRMITSASYLSCWPDGDRLVGSRMVLAAQMQRLTQKFGVSFGVSEYSVRIPEKDGRIPNAVVRLATEGCLQDSTCIDAALWCARVIQADLCISCASTWNYTDAVSTEYTRDGLIEVDTRQEGYYRPTKMLWMLGHFSLFVRPGMVRVRVTRSDKRVFRDCLQELLTTAYIVKSSFVIVFVNMREGSEFTCIQMKGNSRILENASCFRSYLTNADASLSTFTASHLGATFEVPPRSIVTCIGNIIEEGVHYRLQPMRVEKKLSLQTTSASEGCVAGLGDANPDLSCQKWEIVPCGEYIMLLNTHSAMVLTGIKQEGQATLPVHQELIKPQKAEYQKWAIQISKCGGYMLSNVATRTVLEYYGDSVRISKKTGKATQQWNIVPVTTHQQNLPHLVQNVHPQNSPRRRSILTPKHEDPLPAAEWRGTRPTFSNDTMLEPPRPPVIVQVPAVRPVLTQVRYSHMGTEVDEVRAPAYVAPEPMHYVAGDDPMQHVQRLQPPKPEQHSWQGNDASDGTSTAGDFTPLTPIRGLGKSSSFSAMPPSALTSHVKMEPSPYHEISSPKVSLPETQRKTHVPLLLHPGQRFEHEDVPAPTVGTPSRPSMIHLAAPGTQRATMSSAVYDTTLQSEIDRRKSENEYLRKKMLKQEEEAERQATTTKIRDEAQQAAKEQLDKLEAEEALRAQRRGTSHLVLSLAMPRNEFDFTFQRTFKETIAKKLDMKDRNVIVTLIGQDSKSIKVEVRLKGVVDAGERLDKLFEAMSIMDKKTPAVGEEGVGSDDSAESSSDEGKKKAKAEADTKRKRRHRKKKREST